MEMDDGKFLEDLDKEGKQLQQEYLKGKTGEEDQAPEEEAPETSASGEDDDQAGDTQAEEQQAADGGTPPGDSEPEGQPEDDKEEYVPKGELEALQHKISVLEGKLNKEPPRLHEEIKRLNAVVTNQNSLIENMRGGKAESPEEDEAPTPRAKLNPKSYEDYGEEFVNMAEHLNKQSEEFEGLITDAKKTRDQINTVDKKLSESRQASFDERMTRELSNWKELDQDPGWHAWLSEPYGHSRLTRQQVLEDAVSEGSEKDVAGMFKEWKPELADTPAAPSSPKADPLARQQAPVGSRSSGGKEGTSGKDKAVTYEQFDRAERDFIQGKIDETKFNEIAKGYQKNRTAKPRVTRQKNVPL